MPFSPAPVRIGVLGAARIVKSALLVPARSTSGVEVTAIAARSEDRARAYARTHGIRRVHASYDALLADEDIDAVYIPLPAALHGRWMRRTIEVGKHVLCEKPFTANADEAAEIAALAAGTDRVVMEAFHSRLHPLWARLRQIVDSGALGEVRTARASFCAPIPPGKDIRWQVPLGGGALMDLGVYPVGLLRHLLGEPRGLSADASGREGVAARGSPRP